uniref:Uncharacterized protein n=1 Tax=Arundo donax TaxID=35708 RepID=A0A0A9FDI1_ARUDO
MRILLLCCYLLVSAKVFGDRGKSRK